MKTLFFVGGVRSGKSQAALQWAEDNYTKKFFLATARCCDTEMGERIAKHKAKRSQSWIVYEEPVCICETMEEIEKRCTAEELRCSVILVDCLSSWIANCLEDGLDENSMQKKIQSLASYTARAPLALGFVSLEVGLGAIPMHPLARRFGDTLGLCNQAIAQVCQTVLFYTCGLALVVKGNNPFLS